jgi:hypothetical protein
VGINKDKHARIIIMRPETILHSEAGYIFADCSRPTRFFLQFGGGPYMLRQVWRFKINRLRTRSGMKLIEHVAAQMGGIKNERHVHG